MNSFIVYIHDDNKRLRSEFVYILIANVTSINTRKQLCISRVHY